jgi:hypothetical protein
LQAKLLCQKAAWLHSLAAAGPTSCVTSHERVDQASPLC